LLLLVLLKVLPVVDLVSLFYSLLCLSTVLITTTAGFQPPPGFQPPGQGRGYPPPGFGGR
jgi:hypothetical protein